MQILGVIPSRYASTRLPGKPLADIGGKSMIRRVYEQAKQAPSLYRVVVATDHLDIRQEVESFRGEVMMTKDTHPSGTDRCAEVVQQLGEQVDYVINIQGDEPFIHPDEIEALATLLKEKQPDLGTLIKPIVHTEVLADPSKIKVVVNTNGEALYFSRQAIPYLRSAPMGEWLEHHTYYRHLGMYAYQAQVLQAIAKLPPSSLEQAESLEQLRWMEHGYRIHVALSPHDSFSIDTPEDLKRARKQV